MSILSLLPDEEFIVIARKHWIVFLGHAIGVIVATGVLSALIIIGGQFLPDEIYRAIGGDNIITFTVLILSILFLFSFMIVSVIFTNYYLDSLILTNRRLIDCEQKRLFFRDVATIPISNIVDIKAETKGIIQTFFDFGSLSVQTAAEVEEVIIHGLIRPYEVKDAIVQIFQAYGTKNPELQKRESFKEDSEVLPRNPL